MTKLIALLKTLAGAFYHFCKWRAQVTDPAVQQQKTWDEWKTTLTRLKNETTKAETACEKYMATARSDDDSVREFGQLRAIAAQCAKREADHRLAEPPRGVSRPE